MQVKWDHCRLLELLAREWSGLQHHTSVRGRGRKKKKKWLGSVIVTGEEKKWEKKKKKTNLLSETNWLWENKCFNQTQFSTSCINNRNVLRRIAESYRISRFVSDRGNSNVLMKPAFNMPGRDDSEVMCVCGFQCLSVFYLKIQLMRNNEAVPVKGIRSKLPTWH